MGETTNIIAMLQDTVNSASNGPVTFSDMIGAYNALCHLYVMFSMIAGNASAQSYLGGLMNYTQTQVQNGVDNFLAKVEAAKSALENDLPHYVDSNGQIWWQAVGPDVGNNQQKVYYPTQTETASSCTAIQAVINSL